MLLPLLLKNQRGVMEKVEMKNSQFNFGESNGKEKSEKGCTKKSEEKVFKEQKNGVLR
jgi:hypothetical protein